MSVRHLYLVAVATIIACAPAGSTSGTSPSGGVPRKANVLAAAEIAAFNADVTTAYDAVARLRPAWLTARGVKSLVADEEGTEYALVFVDGRLSGPLNSLRDIQAYQVDDIRYYDVAQAGAKFGVQGGSSGVIEVRMKSPPPQR